MRNNKYRVGIIGCGRVAGLLEDDKLRNYPCTHMGAYQVVEQCEVVACCSEGKDRARAFAEKFSIPSYYENYREMLKKEDLDIVSIATYADTHAEITIEAARCGVRAVFCEKAIAVSLKEAKQMIRECKKHGTLLAVNHTRRWDNMYIETKKMLEKNIIGTLQSISGIFSGNLIHTGIHMFDIMLYFVGKAKMVSGNILEHQDDFRNSSGYKFSAKRKLEDKDGFATIIFENGVIGQINGIGKKYFVFELDIIGSEGRIKIGNGLFELWRKEKSKNYSDFFELEFVTDKVGGNRPSAFVCAAQNIVAALEKGDKLLCSGKDAYASLELALAVYHSSSKGGKFIDPRKVSLNKKVVSR